MEKSSRTASRRSQTIRPCPAECSSRRERRGVGEGGEMIQHPRFWTGTNLPRGRLVGTSFGKYTVLRQLATGETSEILHCRVTAGASGDPTVVVKRLLPEQLIDPAHAQHFLEAARRAALLAHPNLAQVREVGE